MDYASAWWSRAYDYSHAFGKHTKCGKKNLIFFRFKEGDFNSGVAKGAIGIAKLIAKEYDFELSELDELPINVPMPERPTLLASIFNFLFTLFIIIMFASLRMGFLGWWLLIPGTHRRRGGFWHGGGFGGNSGGFGGGFGGFGGGLSGGGGASGGW